MLFMVKVMIDLPSMMEFAQKLHAGALDRSAIRSGIYCLKSDPASGFSIWEAETKADFDAVFAAWRPYFAKAEITEVIPVRDAMGTLLKGLH